MIALVEQAAARWKAARAHQHYWRSDEALTDAFLTLGLPAPYSYTCRCGAGRSQGVPR